MKDKDLLKLLQHNGWKVKRIQGSHHILEKDGMIETVPTGLLNSILKRHGLK